MSEVDNQPVSEVPQQQPFVPGLSQPCLMCPYKDAYIASKNAGELMIRAQRAQTLIQNLTEQLDAATEELEKYRSKPDN